MSADHHLLFGLLALQCGFLPKEQLVAALATWTSDKKKSLEVILAEQKVFTPNQQAVLKQLEQEVLAQHDQSAEQSLATLSSIGTLRQELEGLGNSQVSAMLAQVANDSLPTKAFSAETISKDTRREGALRYLTIRMHAKGGLGEVFVAQDQELNREVALKEIQERFADDGESRARFRLEAEITGNLEHPGIVPVYGLGQYENGRPYYAMRFIRGDSLKEAIDSFHTKYKDRLIDGEAGLELRLLLRRFLDVCNAMAYAHSRGVLHRDLKPGNIILGKYGETLVVDWGLAKAQGQSQSADASIGPVTPSSGSGATPTLDGSAVGTPAYMSPEQAAGKVTELGPATDVYSLGATLFHLLTGKLPIAVSTALEILNKAELGEILRPRELRAEVPKPLEAICLKAMAKLPKERYGSPVALADDIDKWLADEPVSVFAEPLSVRARRWIKRHPAMVASSAAGVVLGLCGALLFGYLQVVHANELEGKNIELTLAKEHAEEQRNRAEQREQEAISAVKRFGDAVAGNKELKDNSRLESLRKDLLKEPLGFFKSLRERLQADNDTRPESLAQLASAAFDLANLTNEIGNKQDAIVAHQEALAIQELLARENPSNTEFQSNLAASHNNLGNLLRTTGKPAEALAAYEQSKAIRERLVRDNPTVNEFQSDLASSQGNIGILLGQTGKPFEALAAHEQAKTIQERLARESPSVKEFQSNLALSHDYLGNLFFDIGKLAEALAAHEQAIAIRERLANEEPSVTQFQGDLAGSLNNLGNLFSATGKPSDALVAFEQAKTIRERLARENPSVTQFQDALAGSHNNLGQLFSANGKPTEALAAYEQSKAIRERLAKENPSVTVFQNDLAVSLNDLGELFRATGKPEEALAAFEQAKAIQERLALENPSVTQFQNGLAVSHNNLANLLSNTGKPAEALAAYEQAKTIQERLVRENPSITEFQDNLASTYSNIGRLLRDTGKTAEAIAAHEQAKRIRERIARENPSVTQFQYALARSHNHLAILLYSNGQSIEALVAFEQAKTIRERLARENPSVTQFQSDLADSHNNIGNLLYDAGKTAEALAAYEQAKTIQERLVRENPSVTKFQNALAGIHNNLGNLLSAFGKTAEALDAFEQARSIQERLVQDNPSVIEFQSTLGNIMNSLAKIHLDSKRFAEARDLLHEAIKYQELALATNSDNPLYLQYMMNHFSILLEAAVGLEDSILAEEAERGIVETATRDPQFQELDARLAKVLGGESANDAAELLAFGQRSYDLRRLVHAVQFFGEALEREPTLVNDRKRQIAYNAACSAALAGCEQGLDDQKPDEAERTKLRAQAIYWLRGELERWENSLASATLQQRTVVVQTLTHWQKDMDLLGVRDEAALARLPEAERVKWLGLWKRVEEVRARASSPMDLGTEPAK